MSYDTLISQLAADTKPVKPLRLDHYMARIVALWVAIAAVIVAAIGLREDFGHIASIAKPMFFIGYALLLSAVLFLSSLPGRTARHWFAASMLLLGAGAALLLQTVFYGGEAALQDALSRPNSLACLLSITLFGLVPLYWVVRWAKMAAPSRPVVAGMLAGTVSGALAASSYALHCQQDAIMYIGIWYLSPVLLHTAIGAVLGHKLLRW